MSAPVQACTLISGSSGNSLLLSHKDSTIMLDAGSSGRRLLEELKAVDVDPYTIDALFLSHEHSDHACGIVTMASRFKIPVYAHEESWATFKLSDRQRKTIQVHFIQDGDVIEVGAWKVYPFDTYHDSRASLAFKFDSGDRTVSVLTDTGHVDERMFAAMRGSDLVFIESNYDESMLWNGPYPWPLKRRIASKQGHLSNLHAATTIMRLHKDGTENFVLTHLSENSNTPELAYETAASCLRDQGLELSEDVFLSLAPRYEASLWYDVTPAQLREEERRFEFKQDRLSYIWN